MARPNAVSSALRSASLDPRQPSCARGPERNQSPQRPSMPRACAALCFVLSVLSGVGQVDGQAPAASPVPTAEAAQATQAGEHEEDAQAHTPDAAEFGATAVVERAPAGAQALETDYLRDLPGALGDPVRSLEALPGVTPLSTLLPYPSIRGAPAGGSLFLYDGVPLPGLFHLALGPSVIHPKTLGQLHHYRGYAPASFGRYTGGVIDAQPSVFPQTLLGELELRLTDVNALLSIPLGDSQVTLSGRYGYPGLVASLSDPTLELAYWDYQLKVVHPLGAGVRVEVLGIGSHDSFGESTPSERLTHLSLSFHRLDLRLVRERGADTIGLGLLAGTERGAYRQVVDVRLDQLSPRLFYRRRLGAGMSLALGADAQGKLADVQSRQEGVTLPGDLSELEARGVVGGFAQLRLLPLPELSIDLGLRGDLWKLGSERAAGISPALQARWHLTPEVRLHGALRASQQPVSFVLPVPGLASIETESELQHALHSELGIAYTTETDWSAQLTGFHAGYRGIVFPDPLFGDDRACPAFECRGRFPRSDSDVYGAELFLGRQRPPRPGERLSGWLSYTLSRASATSEFGTRYTPTNDVRHVLNLVGT